MPPPALRDNFVVEADVTFRVQALSSPWPVRLNLRQRFTLPTEAALAAVAETVEKQGEILPPQAPPGYIAGAVNSLLTRCRPEWERLSWRNTNHRLA